MWYFGDQSVIFEQDVLRQIREDDDISFALSDELIWCNEKASSILARGCSSLKGGCPNPKIVFVVVISVFLQRKSLCSLSEDISCQWSALAISEDSGCFVTGDYDRTRI